MRQSHEPEKPMNTPTSSTAVEKPLSDMEAEISTLVEQSVPKHPSQIESEVERIRSSLGRLTSNSIEGLQGLTSELQELQRFLNAEVERVEGEIKSALAGIKIIMETIAPFKNSSVSTSPMTNARVVRPAGFGSKYGSSG
jgi:hypothetical protein